MRDKFIFATYFLVAILNYSIWFLGFSQTLNVSILVTSLAFFLFFIFSILAGIWYLVLFIRYNGRNKLVLLCLFLLYILSIAVFMSKTTSPIYCGTRYLNYKAGGEAKLIHWADSIFQMPLDEVTDDDYTVDEYLKLKKELYSQLSENLDINNVHVFCRDGKKYIQIQYPAYSVWGGSSVYIGDENLIRDRSNSAYKSGNIYLSIQLK